MIKNPKRFALLSLALVLLLFLLPGNALAADSDWDVEVLDDGTVSITGYHGTATNLVIPSTIGGKAVTKIGNLAFSGNTSIQSVTLPEGLQALGYSSFKGCTSLTSVYIPSTIETIDTYFDTGRGPFENCSALNSVSFC